MKWASPSGTQYSSRLRMPNKRTLRNELNILKRKVGRNTPAPVYFRESSSLGTFGSAADSYVRLDYDISATLVARTDFRDNINGDEWYNNSVKLRLLLDEYTEMCRVVIYAPLLADQEFVPTTDDAGMCTIPDPAAFKVYSDVTYSRDTKKDQAAGPHYAFIMRNWMVSLRGLKTIFNGSASNLEKGTIKMMILSKKGSQTVTAPVGTVGMLVQCRDK